MSLQSKDEEKILSIIEEAGSWTAEEYEANFKHCLPILTKFILQTEDVEIGIQVIRFAFGSFLPHFCLETLVQSNNFVDTCLISLLKYLQTLIQALEEKQSHVKQERNLECVILGIDSCKELLKYFLHEDQQGTVFTFKQTQTFPSRIIGIIKLSLKHCEQKTRFYDASIVPYVQNLLQALLTKTLEGCSLVCDTISRIKWSPHEEEEEMEELCEVIAGLGDLAHCLSCLSELKASVVTWKVFASLTRSHSEALKKEGTRIGLASSIHALKDEICEGLLMLKAFEKGSGWGGDTSTEEEKVFLRVLKRSHFNLKIVTMLAEKFAGGYLGEGALSSLLSLVLALFAYSPHGIALTNLSLKFKEKIEEHLSVGVTPLLSHLMREPEFIQEVCVWLERRKKRREEEVEGGGVEECSSFLHCVLAIAEQSLLDASGSSSMMTSLLLDKVQFLSLILDAVPYCHPALSYPETVPCAMRDGTAHEKKALYAHALTHTCGWVAALDEGEFARAERILFEAAIAGGEGWRSFFAGDVLCFIARFGSASLCESHCLLLARLLKGVPGGGGKPRRRNLLFLFARMSAFLHPQTADRIFAGCVAETPDKTLVSELVFYWRLSLSEETQGKMDDLLLTRPKESPMNAKELCGYLERCSAYCRSGAVRVRKIRGHLIADVLHLLMDTLRRFPLDHLDCSLVARLLSLSLDVAAALSALMSTEQVFTTLLVIEEGIGRRRAPAPRCVSIRACEFLSRLGERDLSPQCGGEEGAGGERGQLLFEGTLLKLKECFVALLRDRKNCLLRVCSATALVTFSRHTKHTQVLTDVVAELGEDEGASEDLVRFLQEASPENEEEEGENGAGVHSYLSLQTTTLLSETTSPLRKGKKSDTRILNPIPDAEPELEGGVGCSQKRPEEGVERSPKRRRKMDEEMEEREFLSKLDDVRLMVSGKEESIAKMDAGFKREVARKLKDILEWWEAH